MITATATVGIAYADGIVQLGRIAHTRPDLAEAAIDALKEYRRPGNRGDLPGYG